MRSAGYANWPEYFKPCHSGNIEQTGELDYALTVSVLSWVIMVKRRFFFLFMLVAAWIPVQFVAAWQSMTRMEWQNVASVSMVSIVAPVQAAEMSMPSDDASASSMACYAMGMMAPAHDGAVSSHVVTTHAAVHVGGGCSTFCFGIPPAVVPLTASRSAPVMVPYEFHASFYQDFIPGVQSPPPVFSLS